MASRLSRASRSGLPASSMARSAGAGAVTRADHDPEADHDQDQAQRDRLVEAVRALADTDRRGGTRRADPQGAAGPRTGRNRRASTTPAARAASGWPSTTG